MSIAVLKRDPAGYRGCAVRCSGAATGGGLDAVVSLESLFASAFESVLESVLALSVEVLAGDSFV